MGRPKNVRKFNTEPPRVGTHPAIYEWMRDVNNAIRNLQDMIEMGDDSFMFDGNIKANKIIAKEVIAMDGEGSSILSPKRGLFLTGSATVWDDQQVNISSVRLPASGAPVWTAYKSSQVLEFSASATNTIHFACQMPHRYVDNSEIGFHVHVVHPNSNTGNSVWSLTYSWANVNEDFPTATTSQKTFASPANQDNHRIFGWGRLAPTGESKTLSSLLLCSLSRLGADGADTYGSVIYVVALDFHVKRDKLGSALEYHN